MRTRAQHSIEECTSQCTYLLDLIQRENLKNPERPSPQGHCYHEGKSTSPQFLDRVKLLLTTLLATLNTLSDGADVAGMDKIRLANS